MFNQIEEQLNISTLHFSYVQNNKVSDFYNIKISSINIAVLFANFDETLSQTPFHFDSVLHDEPLKNYYKLLDKFGLLMTGDSTLYIYGLPQWLPYLSVYLDKQGWQFKYWIALETSHPQASFNPLASTHEGILLFVRNKAKFNLRKVRSAHQKCEVCGDYVADWGGKKHLRNPIGYAISDVWDDLPSVKEKEHILSKEVWQRLILLTAKEHSHILCVNYEGLQDLEQYIFG